MFVIYGLVCNIFSGTPFQSYNTKLVPADLSNQLDLNNKSFTFLAHFDSVSISKVKIDTKSLKCNTTCNCVLSGYKREHRDSLLERLIKKY